MKSNKPSTSFVKGEFFTAYTFNFTWHDCSSFTNTPRRICQLTFSARRLKLRNFLFPWIHGFFFSFFVGRVVRVKLIKLNRYHDRFCRSRHEACCFQWKKPELRAGSQGKKPDWVITPESLARRGKWRTSKVWTNHSIGLFWTVKKETKKTNVFLRQNFFLGGLKEHLNKIFFKRGVIVMGVFIAFLNPNLFFFCHNADILIITKSSNWNQERSQVWESYRDCKLYLIKCSLFI